MTPVREHNLPSKAFMLPSFDGQRPSRLIARRIATCLQAFIETLKELEDERNNEWLVNGGPNVQRITRLCTRAAYARRWLVDEGRLWLCEVEGHEAFLRWRRMAHDIVRDKSQIKQDDLDYAMPSLAPAPHAIYDVIRTSEAWLALIRDFIGPRPTAFIASSSESLQLARQLTACLQKYITTHCWVDSPSFDPGKPLIDAILDLPSHYEFGVFLATPDDAIALRSDLALTPRINVLVEFAVFLGAATARSAKLVMPRSSGESLQLMLPSDFSGVLTATYDPAAAPREFARVAQVLSRTFDYELRIMPAMVTEA